MQIRKADTRGHFQNDWLNSWHSFSFSSYYDPDFMEFSKLRVINDDKIASLRGFGRHPHQNMEIITFMLDGVIQHRDSLGNVHDLTAGNVQLMRAGSGIMHSEMNPSDKEAHLLQIWINSNDTNMTPGWWEKQFAGKDLQVLVEPMVKTHRLQDLNSELNNEGIGMAQNGYILSVSPIQASQNINLNVHEFGVSDIYIHIAKGKALLNGDTDLVAGDAAYELARYNNIDLTVEAESTVLIFVFPAD